MNRRIDRTGRWLRVLGTPIVIAALTLAGLLAALLFGEFGRYVSWITLALPVIIRVWTWLRIRISDRAPSAALLHSLAASRYDLQQSSHE